jgi:hypothetical protein
VKVLQRLVVLHSLRRFGGRRCSFSVLCIDVLIYLWV